MAGGKCGFFSFPSLRGGSRDTRESFGNNFAATTSPEREMVGQKRVVVANFYFGIGKRVSMSHGQDEYGYGSTKGRELISSDTGRT